MGCVALCRRCCVLRSSSRGLSLLVSFYGAAAFVPRRLKFCAQQREQVDDALRFVKQARLQRKSGGSGGGLKKDKHEVTAFDRARAEWSQKSVSARGTVHTGDNKQVAWLG